jgi:hypothetical protein
MSFKCAYVVGRGEWSFCDILSTINIGSLSIGHLEMSRIRIDGPPDISGHPAKSSSEIEIFSKASSIFVHLRDTAVKIGDRFRCFSAIFTPIAKKTRRERRALTSRGLKEYFVNVVENRVEEY